MNKKEKIIYDEIRKIIVDYEKDTGIAITSVHMQWHDVMGGEHSLYKMNMESELERFKYE